MKEFVVCDEQINGYYCGNYTIRTINDSLSTRFRIIDSFDTYEEADKYINYLLHPEDYISKERAYEICSM